MVELGTTFARQASPRTGYRGRRRHDALLRQFRKPIVAALLISGDVVAAVTALILGAMQIEMFGWKAPEHLRFTLPCVMLAFAGLRLYTGSGPSPYERFRLRTIAIVGFFTLDFLIAVPAYQAGPLLVGAFCTASILLILGHYIEAALRTLLIRCNLWGAPTLLMGCNDNSRRLSHALIREPALGLTPVGFIMIPPDRPVPDRPLPLPVIDAAPGHLYRQAEFVVFTSASDLWAFRADFSITSPRLLLVEDVHDIQTLWLRTRTLGEAVGIEIRRGLYLHHNQVLKRALDIVLGSAISLVAAPIIAIVALLIKIVDPGPAFYAHERVGRRGAPLKTLKLRTMYADADKRLESYLNQTPEARTEWQRFFKLNKDPRVIPVIGTFLRRASLDELPQLWNVLRGEMSLVGPRPYPAYHMNSFDDAFRTMRVSVPPGLTGMWQVSSRSNGDLHVQKRNDLFYITNWSLWLDLYILLQTVPAVLTGNGAK